MIQGTTPTITLNLPLPTDTIAEAEFTIADYYGHTARKWMLRDMKKEPNALIIQLTQQDTLDLQPTIHKAQLRIKTNDSRVMATKIMALSVEDLLSEDVI